MSTRIKIHGVLLAGIASAGFAIPAMADSMMQPVHEGNITYVTGGIGEGEEHALKASAKNYNLQITNANAKGDFTADENLEISSKDGPKLLSVSDAGPLFYAKLPSGEYLIRATDGNEQKVREVKVSASKPTDIHLIWKQS